MDTKHAEGQLVRKLAVGGLVEPNRSLRLEPGDETVSTSQTVSGAEVRRTTLVQAKDGIDATLPKQGNFEIRCPSGEPRWRVPWAPGGCERDSSANGR